MEEKIPLNKVLDDMYNPDGGQVSMAARDYYYTNYATEEEKILMDREDKITRLLGIFIAVGVTLILGIEIIIKFI